MINDFFVEYAFVETQYNLFAFWILILRDVPVCVCACDNTKQPAHLTLSI